MFLMVKINVLSFSPLRRLCVGSSSVRLGLLRFCQEFWHLCLSGSLVCGGADVPGLQLWFWTLKIHPFCTVHEPSTALLTPRQKGMMPRSTPVTSGASPGLCLPTQWATQVYTCPLNAQALCPPRPQDLSRFPEVEREQRGWGCPGAIVSNQRITEPSWTPAGRLWCNY